MSSFAVAFAFSLVAVYKWQVMVVDASPSGAGGCQRTDFGSVGETHLTRTRTFGPLSDYGLQLSIGPTGSAEVDALDSSSTVPYSIEVGTEYELSLTGDNSYRGVLFRLEGPETNNAIDTTAALDVVDNDTTKIADPCTDIGVGGVTHVDRSRKTNLTAVLTVDEIGDGYILGVTAVVQNRGRFAQWYFTEFVLNAAVPSVSSTPTAEPTAASTTSSPTQSPTSRTTPSPTPSPTVLPTASATVSPTALPSMAPSSFPSSSPSLSPSSSPSLSPSSSPTASPTSKPSVSSTAAPSLMTVSTPSSDPESAASIHSTAGWGTFLTAVLILVLPA